MASSTSNTILNTTEWAKKLNFGRRSVIGNFLEPGLTSANMVLQTILGPPFAWRWNRVVTGFITIAGQQDYTLVNWQAALAVKTGWMTVDDAGNCQVVQSTTGATGSVAPTWNHTLNGTTTDNLVVWQNKGPIGVPVSQQFNLSWIETASIQDKSKWMELTPELCLSSDSSLARPRFLSAQADDGQGAVTFRLMPVPDAAYPVAITLQQKAPVLTGVGPTQTWAPIPDHMASIYNWGYLSLMWLFADDPRFGVANQKFVSQILATAEGLTETQRNIFLQGWQQATGQPVVNANKLSQGVQARGV
jgi:hypothetical protein